MPDEAGGALARLQLWYVARCDGHWEHDYGIEIGTLDNPGWRVRIDLIGTALEGTPIAPSRIDRAEHDWLRWWIENDRYEAAAGPTNLEEAIEVFLDLAERSAQ